MRALIYSHRNGENVIRQDIVQDIIDSLSMTEVVVEKYSITNFRSVVISELKDRGWSDEVVLDLRSNISITSEKNGVGLCLQTGNVSRTYADMIKLQSLFVQGKLGAGVIIVPTLDCAKSFGLCNSATYERLRRELEIFSQVVTMPIVIIGFYC